MERILGVISVGGRSDLRGEAARPSTGSPAPLPSAADLLAIGTALWRPFSLWAAAALFRPEQSAPVAGLVRLAALWDGRRAVAPSGYCGGPTACPRSPSAPPTLPRS